MFPVDKRVEQLKMKYLFNIIHGKAPVYLRLDIYTYLRFNLFSVFISVKFILLFFFS